LLSFLQLDYLSWITELEISWHEWAIEIRISIMGQNSVQQCQ